MAAPFAYVYGQFVDTGGAVRNAAVVTFIPLSTPYGAGDQIVTTVQKAITLDSNGKFGYFPGVGGSTFKLTQGLYRVVLSDVDAFIVSVPGDSGDHLIYSIAVDFDVSKSDFGKPLFAEQIMADMSSSLAVGLSRQGDPTGITTRYVFLGESGDLTPGGQRVNTILTLAPSEIIALGNMNTGGAAGTIDANIGQHFHEYIYPYSGSYPPGSGDNTNHFWYALAAQDWVLGNVTAVTNYFTFPNNERYYKKVLNNIALFVLDSIPNEPDEVSDDSVQAQWLQTQLAAAAERWKIVCFSESPTASKTGYPVGGTGGASMVDWPFASWGADVVIAAGCKFFERITYQGIPLYVVGHTSGGTLDTFGTPVSGSQYRYNTKSGVLVMDANDNTLTFWNATVEGELLDEFTVTHSTSGNVFPYARLASAGGLKITASGLSADIGSADGQVLGGNSLYQEIVTSKFLRMSSIPTLSQVRQNAWLKECVYLVGDDPPTAYYFNKQLNDVILLFNPDYSGSYYSGSRTKLANPTITPSSGSAFGAVLDHTDSGVTLYVSVNGGNFSAFTDWPTIKTYRFGKPTTPVWIAVFATKTGNEDSDIVTANFVP